MDTTHRSRTHTRRESTRPGYPARPHTDVVDPRKRFGSAFQNPSVGPPARGSIGLQRCQVRGRLRQVLGIAVSGDDVRGDAGGDEFVDEHITEEAPTSSLDGPSGPRCPISATKAPQRARQPRAAPIESPKVVRKNPGRNRDTRRATTSTRHSTPTHTTDQARPTPGHAWEVAGRCPAGRRLHDTGKPSKRHERRPCTAATRHTRHTTHDILTRPPRHPTTTPQPYGPHSPTPPTNRHRPPGAANRPSTVVASPASDQQDAPTGSAGRPLRTSRSDSATARGRAPNNAAGRTGPRPEPRSLDGGAAFARAHPDLRRQGPPTTAKLDCHLRKVMADRGSSPPPT